MNELEKSIHDNTNGLDYTLVNDHYLGHRKNESGGTEKGCALRL